jgi:hypothetical protein
MKRVDETCARWRTARCKIEKVVNGELSLKEAGKLSKEQISLKSKKAKEIASPKLAHTPCANSNDAKPNEVKEISEKKAKQVKDAAKKPRPKKMAML